MIFDMIFANVLDECPLHQRIFLVLDGRISRHSFTQCWQEPANLNCGADQQRLQISDLHFDKFPTPATSACWEIRFKTEVCTCSQFATEAMQWIKEVELVDSVDELRSSSSIRGISMPNFESTRCEDCFSAEQNHP